MLGKGTIVNNDIRIIATARMYGIEFATGDIKALTRAIRLGVDARYYALVDGANSNGTMAEYLEMYQSAIRRLRNSGFSNYRDYIGPFNPFK